MFDPTYDDDPNLIFDFAENEFDSNDITNFQVDLHDEDIIFDLEDQGLKSHMENARARYYQQLKELETKILDNEEIRQIDNEIQQKNKEFLQVVSKIKEDIRETKRFQDYVSLINELKEIMMTYQEIGKYINVLLQECAKNEIKCPDKFALSIKMIYNVLTRIVNIFTEQSYQEWKHESYNDLTTRCDYIEKVFVEFRDSILDQVVQQDAEKCNSKFEQESIAICDSLNRIDDLQKQNKNKILSLQHSSYNYYSSKESDFNRLNHILNSALREFDKIADYISKTNEQLARENQIFLGIRTKFSSISRNLDSYKRQIDDIISYNFAGIENEECCKEFNRNLNEMCENSQILIADYQEFSKRYLQEK